VDIEISNLVGRLPVAIASP